VQVPVDVLGRTSMHMGALYTSKPLITSKSKIRKYLWRDIFML
jgi:hypothetical protein